MTARKAAPKVAIAADGTRLAWEEHGAGEAVLLIMGFSFTKEMWFRAIPALATRFRVITFDNRGVGDTIWSGADFTIQTMAEDGFAVLDAAGVEHAHVYGVSLGGGPAVDMALSRPERVRSLVLGCTTAKPATGDPPRTFRTRLFRMLPARLLPLILGRTMYGSRADPAKVREDRRVLNRMRVTRAGLFAQARAIARYKSDDRVGGIRQPTLVLHGTEDRTVPYELGCRLAAAVPGARMVTLEGAGHGYLSDATEEANTAVLDFLAEVGAASPGRDSTPTQPVVG